jgi:hypothetical protein
VTAVLNYLILAFMGVSIAAALYFIGRGLRARSLSAKETYGVGQVEAARSMKIDIVRGIGLVFLSLILLGVYGLSSRPTEAIGEPTLQPTQVLEISTDEPDTAPLTTDAASALNTGVPTLAATTIIPTPVSATIAPTETPTVEPTPEPTEAPPTPAPVTAVVTSEVGVWLRGTPSTTGEQLEWVLNGTVLTVLPGQQTADDFQWQQVRTPAGNEGWVAVDFIQINE